MEKDLQLATRIIELRKLRGLNQEEAAGAIDIKYGTYQKYEYGAYPSRKNIEKIVKYYGCSKNWLLTGEGYAFPEGDNIGEISRKRKLPEKEDISNEFVFVPQFRSPISAGTGLIPDEGFEMRVAFRRDWIKRKGDPKNMSLVKVSGDSMEDTLLDGDLILVNHSKNYLDPQGGLYEITVDNYIMIKRIELIAHEKKIKIISDNQKYSPIEVDLDQVKINGKVIWYGREIEK
ncbi:MAG: S24 family peptidase [Smithella sp.]